MKKILLISGSARNGNCKVVLENIQKNFWLEYSTDLVYIRDYNIKECMGCNKCSSDSICAHDDRMDELLDKLHDADIVVLATPDYFYNVSGLTKLFIDRTYPCYNDNSLHGKKFIYVYVGEDDNTATIKKYLDNAMYGFTICHELSVLGSFAYSAGDIGEFKDMTQAKATTDEIVSIIRKNIETTK